MKLVGKDNYQFYKPFALRPLDPKQRLEFIEYLIMESEMKDNIGLISIDGLADLVDDYNDLKETQNLVQKVMKWTQLKEMHLVTILHNNFGTSKPVGHLGSSVIKKAETVCMIEKDGDQSMVTFTYTRHGAIDCLKYRIEDNGLPKVFDDLNETNDLFIPKQKIEINESDFLEHDPNNPFFD
jgi:hypothetical protein